MDNHDKLSATAPPPENII